MTVENCIKRYEHFKDKDKKEAQFWLDRARAKGYKETKEKDKKSG